VLHCPATDSMAIGENRMNIEQAKEKKEWQKDLGVKTFLDCIGTLLDIESSETK